MLERSRPTDQWQNDITTTNTEEAPIKGSGRSADIHTHTHHVPAHRSSGSPHRDRSLSSCVTLPNIPILVSITRNACMHHPRHTNRPSLFVLFPAQSECMQHSNRVTLSHDGHQGLHHLVNARCFWAFGSTAALSIENPARRRTSTASS